MNRSGIVAKYPAYGNTLIKLIARRYQVLLIDERYTSKVCSKLSKSDVLCGKYLDALMVKNKDNQYVEQYGVRVSDDDDNSNSNDNNNTING
jgi:hypothetical protein